MASHTAELRSSNSTGSPVNRILFRTDKKTERKARSRINFRIYLRVCMVNYVSPQLK